MCVFFALTVPKRRRPARSIFDGFRDFQTETSKYTIWPVVNLVLIKYYYLLTLNITTIRVSQPFYCCLFYSYNDYECFPFLVRQEQELRNGGTVDKKLSTLADLFRPPIELMHKGSFETVRSHSLDTLHHTSLFSLCELLVKFQMVTV